MFQSTIPLFPAIKRITFYTVAADTVRRSRAQLKSRVINEWRLKRIIVSIHHTDNPIHGRFLTEKSNDLFEILSFLTFFLSPTVYKIDAFYVWFHDIK